MCQRVGFLKWSIVGMNEYQWVRYFEKMLQARGWCRLQIPQNQKIHPHLYRQGENWYQWKFPSNQ